MLEFTGDEIGALLKELPGDAGGGGGHLSQVREKLNRAASHSKGSAIAHVPVTHDEVKALHAVTSKAVTGPLAHLRAQLCDVSGGPGGGPIAQCHQPPGGAGGIAT
jgi:hypothetical protein